jgi:uncharacterized protein (DUF2062 family)
MQGHWTRLKERLAALGDSPKRTAAAFAVGVFLSFSPFLGLQIAMGLAASLAFKLHKVAVFIGLCTNLPWIMIPWYALTTAGAGAALGFSLTTDLRERFGTILSLPIYRAVFWERSIELLGPYFWSFVIGSTAGALVLGVLAYFVSLRMLGKLTPGDARC